MRELSHLEDGAAPASIKIHLLLGKHLTTPLEAVVEADLVKGFIARLIEFPVYGYADDPDDAVEVLREGLEQICRGCDDLSDGWLLVRGSLKDGFSGK